MLPETRARVLESARRLDYRPDTIARTLVTGTSQTIGVLIPTLVEPYWAQIADAIEKHASEQGYSVLLASTRGEPRREDEMLEMLFGKRVDGVIIGGLSGETNGRAGRRAGAPLVLLEWDATPQWDLLEELRDGMLSRRLRRLQDEPVAGEWLGHVSTDDTAGGAQVVRHLLELGHTRFGFLVPPPVRPYLLRLLGMRIALEQARIELGPVVCTADTFEGGREAAARLLASDSPPTALVCASDAVAVGAIKAAHELGARVPADVSIAGYDDIELSAYLDPSLTTLRNPMRELGEAAVDLLLHGSADERPARSPRLTGVLVPRASTGRAP